MEDIINPIRDTYNSFKKMKIRDYVHQGFNLALVIFSALMIWKSFMILSGTDSPVVVVLTGSMEPTNWRGDILFLWRGENHRMESGEICLFNVKAHEKPIVQRWLESHVHKKGLLEVLSKGDNNEVDDRQLYNGRNIFLYKEDLIGRAVGYLPYVGYVTILLNDNPLLKYLLVGIMGILVLTTKEN